MDYLAATQKIMFCIETAKTLEHHKAIAKMIGFVYNHAGRKDKSLLGALVFWSGITNIHTKKIKNKFGRLKSLFYICITIIK
jgi:hypothetical protein